jgi:hypothetical protein
MRFGTECTPKNCDGAGENVTAAEEFLATKADLANLKADIIKN